MTDTERRPLLLAMGLVTTADLLESLRCSKATLGKMRAAGLRQYGAGQQKFYRLSEVADVLAKMGDD